MRPIQRNTWTWTSWVWDGEIHTTFNLKIKPNESWFQGGIKNYGEFLKKVRDNQRYRSVKEKLQTLKDNLKRRYWKEIDPIVYIANLYFWRKLSAQDVMIRVNELWFDYNNVNSILSFFNKTLWWQLREGSEQTEVTKKKRGTLEGKWGATLKEHTLKVSSEIRASCMNIINNIPIPERIEFDNEILKKWKPLQKVLYILEKFRWISEDSIALIYSQWIGLEVISNTLQTILNETIANHNLKIELKLHKNSLIWMLKKKWVYREKWNLKRTQGINK